MLLMCTSSLCADPQYYLDLKSPRRGQLPPLHLCFSLMTVSLLLQWAGKSLPGNCSGNE